MSLKDLPNEGKSAAMRAYYANAFTAEELNTLVAPTELLEKLEAENGKPFVGVVQVYVTGMAIASTFLELQIPREAAIPMLRTLDATLNYLTGDSLGLDVAKVHAAVDQFYALTQKAFDVTRRAIEIDEAEASGTKRPAVVVDGDFKIVAEGNGTVN